MPYNENQIEQSCLQWFQDIRWQYQFGKDHNNLVDPNWRENPEQVVLKPLLREAIARLNPNFPVSAVDEVVKNLSRFDRGSLVERNHQFHQSLRQGMRVKYLANGQEKNVSARVVDFDNPDNNHFLVVNQFKIKGEKCNRIPDVVCFINGLPIAVLELKNPFNENVDLGDAYNQLQTYKDEIRELFIFNEALIISNGSLARIGSLTANMGRFMPWRVEKRRMIHHIGIGN